MPPKPVGLSDLTKLSRDQLNDKLGHYKTWIERRAKSNDDQRKLCNTAHLVNSFIEDSVQRCLDNSNDTMDKFTSTADALLHAYEKEEQTEAIKAAVEVVKANIEKYLGNIEHSMLRLQEAFSELQQRERDAAPNPPAGGGGGGGGGYAAVAGARVPRSNDALKPPVLLHTDTPTVLTDWCKRFRIWYKSSHFDAEDRDCQLAYLNSCIDQPLWGRIEPLLGDRTPIIADEEDPSCLKVLRSEFLKLYPLFNRRLDFYRYQSTSGQGFTDYVTQLNDLATAAELPALTVDEQIVFRVLTGFKDEQMRSEFLKLDSPTGKDLIELGQRLESVRLAKAKLADPQKVNQTRSGGGQGSGQGGGKGGGGSKGGSGGSEKSEKKNSKDDKKKKSEKLKCPYCAWGFSKEEKLKEHKASCPAKEGKCDGCGGKGHYKPACKKRDGNK